MSFFSLWPCTMRICVSWVHDDFQRSPTPRLQWPVPFFALMRHHSADLPTWFSDFSSLIPATYFRGVKNPRKQQRATFASIMMRRHFWILAKLARPCRADFCYY